MSRLHHSAAGFVRLMQMSRNQLFVFVEGWSDRNVYDRIVEAECLPRGVLHEVRTGNELPNQSGGKDALLQFFSYLRRRRLLVNEFFGKRTAVLFFLDKDLDDLLHRRKRSPHVVYTQYYDFENYLFRYGDLVRAGASAAGLDERSVRTGLADRTAWLTRAITAWRDWVSLCVISRRYNASCAVTYRRPSPLNSPPFAPTDPVELARHEGMLQLACGFPPAAFSGAVVRVRRKLDLLIRRGDADQLFKGKWYRYFLAADLRAIARGRTINGNGLEDRVVDVLRATLDVSGTWANRYRMALQFALAYVV